MGFIYAISAPNGLVKIGRAANPRDRFSTIQCGSPLPLKLEFSVDVNDDVSAERVLHRRLRPLRHHGEWFEISVPEAQFYLEVVCRQFPAESGEYSVWPRMLNPALENLIGMGAAFVRDGKWIACRDGLQL